MKSYTKTMTGGSPMRLILSFAFPILMGNIFQQFYNIADTAVVGRFLGADSLAAMGVTSNPCMLLFSLATGLTGGAGVIIAQYFGAEDFRGMRSVITALIRSTAALCVVITVAGLAFSAPILRLIGTPENILPKALLYMRIMIVGCASTFAYNICSSMLRSMGNTLVPLIILIASCCINICCDLLFITVLHTGIGGAAAATVLAQIISVIGCLLFIYARRRELHLNGLGTVHEKGITAKIFRAGLPSAIQCTMISVGCMSVQRLINSFGTMAIAAYSAVTKFDSAVLMIVVSMAMALSVYSSQNIGAKKYDRIDPGLIQTLIPVLLFCLVMKGVYSVFGRRLLYLFLDPASAYEAVEIGVQYMKIIGFAYFMAGIMRCYQNVIQGAGDVNVAMITGIAELAMRVAASYVLVGFMGLKGLWIAIPISWGFGSLIPLIRYYSGKWKDKAFVE